MRRDIAALPDLVFATAAEPQKVAGWLPEPWELVGVNDGVLILRAGDRLAQVRLTADLDRLVLSWTALADDGCTGSLRVSPLGAGQSVAELELDHSDETLAARLLEALADGVEATFTPG
ncbi:hypothetical protein [Saccharothrix australiensis]|uniref:Polyketide cyclase/dehydrase/lipid transport protein n=1 Tax=Saccharothrix australiensis TaxID=2072 RepID=A0A495W560_9PSEU|nr:hypothetical protein [Saccharothrix australiensis]RKT56270.1 hypothetical protein C8E97_4963 [Saccharothrix australiensis]